MRAAEGGVVWCRLVTQSKAGEFTEALGTQGPSLAGLSTGRPQPFLSSFMYLEP